VIDMNLSPLWADELALGGHDAVHWRDVGATNAADEEIAAWAAREDRCVLTGDLDFAAMVAMGGMNAPAVVQIRSGNTDPAAIGAFVRQSVSNVLSQLVGGAILTIDGRHARLRPGPGQFSSTDEN
jgi:predicted nuclease of predicted toxin-antitoxin system